MQQQQQMVKINDNLHLIKSLHLELMLAVSKGALGCRQRYKHRQIGENSLDETRSQLQTNMHGAWCAMHLPRVLQMTSCGMQGQ
jgi:hypothetical protein